jgi:hypothetical protein
VLIPGIEPESSVTNRCAFSAPLSTK